MELSPLSLVMYEIVVILYMKTISNWRMGMTNGKLGKVWLGRIFSGLVKV